MGRYFAVYIDSDCDTDSESCPYKKRNGGIGIPVSHRHFPRFFHSVRPTYDPCLDITSLTGKTVAEALVLVQSTFNARTASYLPSEDLYFFMTQLWCRRDPGNELLLVVKDKRQ